ncbi:MAG TPA: prepilin-type N-terminal cleavage/methylation domain-containing protein [Gemmatimonadaceae bacterium]|nr:prepilin-type N-terminal cleavage/methylation domain-containing protein [Gemmatimonadaceae bacterium]
MRRHPRPGFTLLEVLVALVLFAAVLLGIVASGQVILARLYESDLRLRAALSSQSVLDSLRSTACARLASGGGTNGILATAWAITDGRDVARVDLTVTVPQRRAASRTSAITSLLQCLEP